ncbi:hypothetical protein [Brevundimonas sp.]|jgi:hypothetical protein|uniref:hypothetical protein n=1 Tax=Brevundimonas sp. TaxID=1871086 RepID=UPI003783D608
MSQAQFTAEMMIALAKGNVEKEMQDIVTQEGFVDDISKVSYDILFFLTQGDGIKMDVRRQRLYIEAKVKKYIQDSI